MLALFIYYNKNLTKNSQKPIKMFKNTILDQNPAKKLIFSLK